MARWALLKFDIVELNLEEPKIQKLNLGKNVGKENPRKEIQSTNKQRHSLDFRIHDDWSSFQPHKKKKQTFQGKFSPAKTPEEETVSREKENPKPVIKFKRLEKNTFPHTTQWPFHTNTAREKKKKKWKRKGQIFVKR